jgi:site-specific recombinase XerC
MGNRFDNVGLRNTLTTAECHLPADGKPWHFLRHTFASHFMMAGGNILTLQKLLGHRDVQTTMRYAHLAPDFLASEVARMSFASPSPAGVSDMAEKRRQRALKGE